MPSSLRPPRGLRAPIAVCLLALLAAPAFADDVTAPARIIDLDVLKDGGNLRLVWTAVATDATGGSESVDFYRVYRGTAPDFVVHTGDATQ